MRPLTFSSNKHLIPLANKPLIFYAIEAVAKAGIKEVGINYNPGQLDELKGTLGTGQKWGIKLTYILQEKALGLANIVQSCQPFIGKSKFVMHLGDNIFHGGIKSLVNYFKMSKSHGLLTVIHHPENLRLGVPFFNKKGHLIKYVEKPKKVTHDLAIPGLYFADEHIFKCFSGKDAIKPSVRGEYEIPSAFQWLIDHHHRVETREFKGVWKDPGKFDDWIETNQFLLDADLKNGSETKFGKNVKVEGRVKIGKRCQIKNSHLRGPSVIGEKVVIENSFVGPYSSIGDGCQIVNANIQNTILMEEVVIRNLIKPIDASLIGKGTLIEANRPVSNSTELFLGNQCVLKL